MFIHLVYFFLKPGFYFIFVADMKNTIIIILAFSLCSCATVFRGSKQVVKIKDLPQDSTITVYYNGAKQPTGTSKVKTPRKDPGTITISQTGCNTQNITLEGKASGGFILLDVVTGLVPLAVDFGTGAIYKTKDIQYLEDCP